MMTASPASLYPSARRSPFSPLTQSQAITPQPLNWHTPTDPKPADAFPQSIPSLLINHPKPARPRTTPQSLTGGAFRVIPHQSSSSRLDPIPSDGSQRVECAFPKPRRRPIAPQRSGVSPSETLRERISYSPFLAIKNLAQSQIRFNTDEFVGISPYIKSCGKGLTQMA